MYIPQYKIQAQKNDRFAMNNNDNESMYNYIQLIINDLIVFMPLLLSMNRVIGLLNKLEFHKANESRIGSGLSQTKAEW